MIGFTLSYIGMKALHLREDVKFSSKLAQTCGSCPVAVGVRGGPGGRRAVAGGVRGLLRGTAGGNPPFPLTLQHCQV